ncbi:hypothetical protein [uncultured Thiodictyon sp.]|uniref:hypothetical protein n=1 Tax=uncultured Thiodictyon sp. TaxID=1846217 RepID=UPI0025D0ED96|nr:hypothetical protein [uncultured Thiodictyon sp.]
MAANTTDHAEAAAMLALATPALYRKNLFRVLGIPVTATPQDVRRRQKRLDMARKLGTGAAADGQGLLALRDPSDEENRTALERLNDPKSRLLDELFWFWPLDGEAATDPALTALERGDVQGAFDAWALGSGDPNQEMVRAHNRTVLNHMIALDLSAWMATGPDTETRTAPFQAPEFKAETLWKEALSGWRAMVESEPFRQRLEQRADELSDPQLTSESVRRIRATLPDALTKINAQLALDAAERGDDRLARSYAAQVGWAASAPDAGNEALRTALAPIRHRIDSLCEQAKKMATDDAKQGARAASGLLEKTKLLLRSMDLLLAEEDISRSATHDAIAEAVLKCLIEYGNQTEDWKEVTRLMDAAIKVATGEIQKARLEENRKTALSNHQVDLCYFCEQEKGNPTEAIKIEMYGDVNRRPNYAKNTVEITWRHRTIEIPRCNRCATRHRVTLVLHWGVFVSSWVLFYQVIGAMNIPDWEFNSFLSALILTAITFSIDRIILWRNGMKPRSRKLKHPTIRDLGAKGWSFGNQPQN